MTSIYCKHDIHKVPHYDFGLLICFQEQCRKHGPYYREEETDEALWGKGQRNYVRGSAYLGSSFGGSHV